MYIKILHPIKIKQQKIIKNCLIDKKKIFVFKRTTHNQFNV